jgi:predicted glycoside hydrolase/deacetylase ChbG (UPF0249 family)
LIVNADDFGQSIGVNRGVVQAHERGIVTSASLMVRWPAAALAASYARDRPEFDVGLHVDLGEWAFRGGSWTPVYEVVDLQDTGAIREEVARQLTRFRDLLGREPTHLDSHQHVHQRESAREPLLETARRLSVPLRHFSKRVRHCGDFYGQTAQGAPLPDAISVERLKAILAAIPAGITELGCHPGIGTDLDTMYREERSREVEILCDPRIKEALRTLGISLETFEAAGAAGTSEG